MIFFGGIEPLLVVERQWVTTGKNPKSGKNPKKSAKYFPWDPAFSAKTGGFWAAEFASGYRCEGWRGRMAGGQRRDGGRTRRQLTQRSER
jgi:hypothetical protein